MHKRYIVKLDQEERRELSELVRRENKKVAAKKRIHANILLLADSGEAGPAWTDPAVTEVCQVTVRPVENCCRKRLVLEDFESALNRKSQVRPSRQKILDEEKEAHVVKLCCEQTPPGHARWTLKRIVELEIVETVSEETVRWCLKKTT